MNTHVTLKIKIYRLCSKDFGQSEREVGAASEDADNLVLVSLAFSLMTRTDPALQPECY